MPSWFANESGTLLLSLPVAFTLSLILVGAVKFIAPRFGFTDRSNPNTGNPGGAAMGGGVGVVLALVLATWIIPSPDTGMLRTAAVIGAVCIVGFIDDIIALHPGVKVLGQCACIAFYLMQSTIALPYLMVVSAFLLLASNSWNVVDVMDALLGCIGTICLLCTSVILLVWGPETRQLGLLGLIATGSMGAFLIWNRYPARVLLGDAGSLPMGMIYGVLVVEGFLMSSRLGLVLLIPGLVPFFEVGFLIIQRSRKHIPFYRVTPDHFALRLKRNGYPIPLILRYVTVVETALSLIAVSLVVTAFHPFVTGLTLGTVPVGVLVAYRFFNALPTRAASQ